MRSAEEAGGHAAELMRRGSCARPDRAGALASDVVERAPERAQAPPARMERDLRDGQVGVAEQCGRPLDAPGEQVPVRRNAESLLEGSREMGLGDAAHAREAPDGPLFVRGAVHPVLCAQQSAQQLGILTRMTSDIKGPCLAADSVSRSSCSFAYRLARAEVAPCIDAALRAQDHVSGRCK